MFQLIENKKKHGMLLLTVLVSVACVSSSSVFAAQVDKKMPVRTAAFDEKYFTIGSVQIKELGEETLNPKELPQWFLNAKNAQNDGGIIPTIPSIPGNASSSPDAGASDATPADQYADQIVNLGKKIWDVIVANKPVVNISVDSASALPVGVKHWTELESWQAPKARLFGVKFVNLLGSTVVDFTFRLVYTYGGGLSGKGMYLTNVAFVPANLEVAWGYTYNAKSSVVNVTNAGTHDSPVAAAEVMFSWSVDTILKHSEGSSSYYVKGDGYFQDLSAGTQ